MMTDAVENLSMFENEKFSCNYYKEDMEGIFNKIYAYLQKSSGNYDKAVDFGAIVVPDNETEIIIEKEDYESLTQSIKLELSKMEFEVLQMFLAGMTYIDIAESLKTTEK